MTRTSNYGRMRDAMERAFLRYPQEDMIQKFSLDHDAFYLYLPLASRRHRVGRKTGRVEYETPAGWLHADYNASMTIFDVLCCSRPDCRLCGRFTTLSSLPGQVQGACPGADLFAPQARCFSGRPDALRRACEALGGTPQPVGDAAYQLPLFPFLPVVLQFWDADDEFDAVLKLMWDENILDYLHYETIFFAAAHLLERLTVLAGGEATEV